ncbi:TRAM domain-containing protein, partial [Candidatus Sumerlaeota bacterium]|nr:TRAM domain-containing protein [Candidatus Sumerlaeota bacterium]
PPRLIFNMIFGYYGVVMALKHESRLSLSRLKFFISNPRENTCILDTNVIIDGRVKDLYETHFLKGEIIIPEFILRELQLIADSTDSQKRSRGRRGLENLEQLQETYPNLQIWEKDYEDVPDVDHKLIQLAKELGAELLTNDYNLNKVASLHQIRVLNINDLAQALKPSFFVGDEVHIRLIRVGKEAHQGVGYLEDGTMVVVDDAKHLIGNEVDIEVTSVLQTSAGRMLFGRMKEYEKGASRNNDQRKPGTYGKTEYPNRSVNRA